MKAEPKKTIKEFIDDSFAQIRRDEIVLNLVISIILIALFVVNWLNTH